MTRLHASESRLPANAQREVEGFINRRQINTCVHASCVPSRGIPLLTKMCLDHHLSHPDEAKSEPFRRYIKGSGYRII
ncbi:hypothetical protein E2C01_020363 [Portunus trituberculatus]|uniref:Uncharacterized protein n=1 Tax=Portunus trituberculatus TaxID=210409 RepID=A0A5B7E1H5_PORTR|nr:hypothetical protein [Portunus trituberculatus]